MDTTTRVRLYSLVESAKTELQKNADEYGAVVKQLGVLRRALDANEDSDEALKAALRAFPAKLRPMRAGAPAGGGLKETRKLWEELNQIVRSRQEGKDSGGVSGKSRQG